jgi:hypothetical protein
MIRRDCQRLRKEAISSLPKARLFGDLHCEEVKCRIPITHEKFDLTAFTKAIRQAPKPFEWGDVVCPSDSDYHVHIHWLSTAKRIRLEIGYYSGSGEPSLVSAVPIRAEGCMKFLAPFFNNPTAHADIHAEFSFGLSRQSRFPLPLRTTVGACKAEIDGIGLRLTESPSGVTKLWLTQGKDGLEVQLFADRRIVFHEFSIADEITEFVSVIDGLTEVRA